MTLSELASEYKKRLTKLIHTVGITGSVGKTTTKEFLKTLCQTQYYVHATEGNLNNKIGLPLSILTAPHETEILVLELGASTPGEISALSKLAEPTVAVITSIGSAHIGSFGGRAGIAAAKLEITDGLGRGRLIIPYGEPLLSGKSDVTFSQSSHWARVSVRPGLGSKINLFIKGKHRLGATFAPKGRHMLECLSAACAAADAVGITRDNMKHGIEAIKAESVRHKIIPLGDFSLLDDCYNASRESVLAALELLFSLDAKKRSLLLGDICELGEYSEEIHRELGRKIARLGLHRLYLVGKEVRFVKDEAVRVGFNPERVFSFLPEEYEKIGEKIIENHKDGELILVKGSRKIGLERVIQYLTEENQKGI